MAYSFPKDSHRIQKINDFLTELFQSPNEKKTALAKLNKDFLATVTPLEVFGLEWFKSDTMLTLEEIKQRAGKIINVLHRGLETFVWDKTCSKMMVLLLKENQMVLKALSDLKPRLTSLETIDSRLGLAAKIQGFAELEKKFAKAENLLYPVMEKRLPSATPLKVLWSIHDDIRQETLDLPAFLANPSASLHDVQIRIGEYFFRIASLIEKEELLLYPAASKVIDLSEWNSMSEETGGFGIAFGAEGQPVIRPKQPLAPNSVLFTTRTGFLHFEELELLLNLLPLELTYIDENDIVQYFNEPKIRLFSRTPQIIGRNVELCHPPKSVAVVQKILASFREGKEEMASMWFSLKGRFVHIDYVALRDKDNRYKGCLEIVQDATELRQLSGENRTF